MNVSGRLLAAALLCFITACSRISPPDGDLIRPQAFGTPQNEQITALTAHSTGVYAAGNTSGSLYAANRGSSDVFLVKFGADKRTLWSRQFGTSAADRVVKVATDALGNVYLFGQTSGALARENRGRYDYFLRKYAPSGSVLWTRQFGLEYDDRALDLRVTPNSVYVLGQEGFGDFVLYRYTPGGDTWWKRSIRPTFASAEPYSTRPSLSFDDAGNVYVGNTVPSLDEPNASEYALRDILLYKFSGAGAPLWTKRYSFEDRSSLYGLAAHGSRVYLLASTYLLGDDDSFLRLYDLSASGEVGDYMSLGPDEQYEPPLYNTVRFYVGISGIYTDTLTRYASWDGSEIPDERTLAKRRFDGSLVWERDWTGVNTPNSILERAPNELYVGGYTGNVSDPDILGDASLVRLSAATGATVWNK